MRTKKNVRSSHSALANYLLPRIMTLKGIAILRNHWLCNETFLLFYDYLFHWTSWSLENITMHLMQLSIAQWQYLKFGYCYLCKKVHDRCKWHRHRITIMVCNYVPNACRPQKRHRYAKIECTIKRMSCPLVHALSPSRVWS